MDNKKLLGSVIKAFDILNIISDRGKITFKKLRELTGFPPPSLHRYLQTLKYIKAIKENGNNEYTLGESLLIMKLNWLEADSLVQIVDKEMKRISELTGETTHMAILSEDLHKIIYLHTILGDRAITMKTPIGKTGPSYATALGKSLLATIPKEHIIRAFSHFDFEKFTSKTINNLEDLLKEIEKVKKSGIAIDNEESEEGILCYGVAIQNRAGKTVAAMSVSGFKMWMEKHDKNKIFSILIEAKERLKESLMDL